MATLLLALLSPLLFPLIDYYSQINKKLEAFIRGLLFGYIPSALFMLFYSSGQIHFSWIPFFLIGAAFNMIADRIVTASHKSKDIIFYFLSLTAMSVHEVIDGITLNLSHGSDQAIARSIIFGVILHRIPTGLFYYHFLKPRIGFRKTFLALLFLSVCTFAGFFWAYFNTQKLKSWDTPFGEYILAFVLGGFMHLIHHEWRYHSHAGRGKYYISAGFFLSTILFVVFYLSGTF